MFFLLVSSRFSILSLNDCIQKAPIFDLESPARYSMDFLCVIHEVFV